MWVWNYHAAGGALLDSYSALAWSQEPSEVKALVVERLLAERRPMAFPALLEMPYGECSRCLRCPVHIPMPEITTYYCAGGPNQGNPYR